MLFSLSLYISRNKTVNADSFSLPATRGGCLLLGNWFRYSQFKRELHSTTQLTIKNIHLYLGRKFSVLSVVSKQLSL